MADLSAVKLPNNATYNLKDAKLRDIVGEPTAPYTEVEWVESNGTQYVYLDWKPPIATWGFEADFIIKNTFNTTQAAWRSDTNANNAGALFGTRNASGVNCVECNTYSTNGYLRIGGSGSVATSATFKKDKTRQTVKLIGTTLTHSNGTTSTVTRVSETANKPYANMTVFCFHEGIRRSGTGNLAYPSTSRIYSLKFYDGTTLKVDLVGAIRNKDGVTGLYDKIKKHFYPAHGMTYGSVVGDLGEPDTITSTITKSHIIVYADNRTNTRLIRATVPELDRLDDGQQITLIYSTAMSNSAQTTELAGWDDTSSNANIYLKLTLADNSTTEWIPCYYSNTGRLAGHYGSGTPIFLTYRENALLNATTTSAGTAVMRGWWHDPDYNTDDVYTRYSDTLLAGLNGVKRYSLNMRDANGNWTSIMNEDNNANATGKTAYSGGLMLGGILYHNSGSNIAAGGNTGQMCESRGGIDFRYSVNGVTSTAATTELQLRKPVYLVGTAGSDGLFYLDQTKWWTQTSFETGKVYVLVGTAYSSYYAIFVSVNNPVYTWDGTKLVEFDDQRIRTAESKLAGIASGAEVNQNAFSNVKVGSTTVSADTKTDTLELAGSNVTLTPDATNDKVTIGITASNVTTALGTTAVARATGDASGNAIASTYVKKSGDTMSGLLTLKADQYGDSYTSGALNLSNSNIYGVNSVYTADLSEDSKEGIHFYRDATHVDSLWAKQGNLYFTPNRALNDTGTSHLVLNASSNVSEANLVWGGKNFSAGYGPIDAAMIGELGSNRIAFIKKESVTVEYSRDAGETWDVYDDMGYCLFGAGRSYTIGKADSTHKATENVGMYQLRVTIDTTVASVYTVLNKFVIYVSTNQSLNCTCKIQKATYGTPDTFVDHTDDIPISGWTGWNVINTTDLTTHGNAASQFGKVRFLFKENGASGTAYNGLNVSRIMAFGGLGWNTPSNMARTGHLYSYDSDQNVSFPGDISPEVNNSKALGSASKKWSNVYSSAFVGTLIGNVAYATCDTAAGTAAKTATITPATTAFTLEVGRMVNVKFDNTNSAAVADISLNVNGTGAKHITYMYNNTRSNLPAVGYIVADFIYQFIYDGTYWCIQNIHYNTNSTYNLGNNNLYNTIIARELIKAQSIVVGDSTGYETAYPGVTFDVTHPILFYGNTTDLAKNGTNYNQFFTSVYDRNLATIYSTFTGTKNATVYLVGTISGDIVTLSDPMLTCTKPTSADGKVYIPIGRLGNQSNGKNYFFFNCTSTVLYEFKNGSFRRYSPINLSASTSSTSTTDAATSSAVKTAYDLANQANGTANTALSGVNGTLIYDHTYTIANGVATFTAHVYCKGVEVTNNYADADFSWSYRIDNTISGTGTPSVVSLGTGKTKTVNIAVLGLGGHVIGTFTTT